MKKIILLLLVLSSNLNIFSQKLDNESIYEKLTWDRFKAGKLYIPLKDKGESEFDKAIMDAVKKNWTFNQFEFIIDDNRYIELKKAGGNVFLFVRIYDNNIFIDLNNYYWGTKPPGLTLKTLYKVEFPDSTSNPNAFLPLGVKNVQWYCNLLASGKVKNHSGYKKEWKSNKNKIAEKPLYILDKYLNKQIKNISDIKEHYKGEVYVISDPEFKKLLIGNDDINLFVCKALEVFGGQPPNYYLQMATVNYVYNLKTGALLYYDLFNHVNIMHPVGINKFYLNKWNNK